MRCAYCDEVAVYKVDRTPNFDTDMIRYLCKRCYLLDDTNKIIENLNVVKGRSWLKENARNELKF